jgi:hypothetical protein
MLDVLHRVESLLWEMLENESDWHSLDIDYHPPRVERLWRQFGEYRINLHRIHPCEPKDALIHPHPWPSAVRVFPGIYEMGMGFGTGIETPPLFGRIIVTDGFEYEMTHIDSWHYVRPIERPSFSLMVTGRPWDREKPVLPEAPLKPLAEVNKKEIFAFFRTRHMFGL